MIDRIKVRLDFPLIDTDNKLKLTPIATVAGEPTGSFLQLRYIDGRKDKVGHLAYDAELIKVCSFNGYIYAEFNYPRLKSGSHNTWPVTQSEARRYTTELSRHLANIGLVSNLSKATVINLELFANAATKYPFSTFRPLLELIDIPRRTRAVHDGSYTFYNTQRKEIIYDKRAQFPEDIEVPNLLRYELALKSDDAIEAFTGTKILGQIIDRWDLINEKLIGRARDLLFGINLADESIPANIEQLIGQKKRKDVIDSMGAIGFLKQFGSISAIREELRRQRYKPYEARSFILKLKKYAVHNAHTEISMCELREELFNKILEGLTHEK